MSFQAPMVRELERSDIECVLRRNGVGRIAFVLEQRVDVEPIHFAFAGGWIYGRTAQGARLRTVQHDRSVTFHVDEIDGVFAWRSVVAHGSVTVLPLDPSPEEREQWEEGLAALQQIGPVRIPSDDGLGYCGTTFRIRLDEVNGRCCGAAAVDAWSADTAVAAKGRPTEPHASSRRRWDVLDSARL